MEKQISEFEIRHTLSLNLRRIRKQNKLTQTGFAVRMDVDQKRVGAWEEQRSAPPLHILVAISEEFSVDLKDLLTKDVCV